MGDDGGEGGEDCGVERCEGGKEGGEVLVVEGAGEDEGNAGRRGEEGRGDGVGEVVGEDVNDGLVDVVEGFVAVALDG